MIWQEPLNLDVALMILKNIYLKNIGLVLISIYDERRNTCSGSHDNIEYLCEEWTLS